MRLRSARPRPVDRRRLASIPEYGTWLVELLDALHIDRAALAGHSMGGAIVLDVARRFPAQVAALALLATGPTLRAVGVAGRVAQRLRRNHGAHRPAGLCTHRRR
ncbi:MAG: alpha/beta fold hydrolase [Caldilineaceae bacterium]